MRQKKREMKRGGQGDRARCRNCQINLSNIMSHLKTNFMRVVFIR